MGNWIDMYEDLLPYCHGKRFFYAYDVLLILWRNIESKGERKMTTEKKGNKKLWLGLVGLVVLVVAMLAAYIAFAPKPTQGSKEITIEVVNKAKESTMYELKTDAEYLRQAMEEAEGLTFDGTESEYGLMISTVNGEVADYSVDGGYWGFYLNNEYCNYGIDTQPVTDGDAFQIIYTTN